MSTKTVDLGVRLAIRSEGEWVNAYFAKNDTMVDAMLVGTIARAAVENPEVFDLWKNALRVAMADFVEGVIGSRPEFKGERAAPEHERSGRG